MEIIGGLVAVVGFFAILIVLGIIVLLGLSLAFYAIFGGWQ
jgi:hypothetical protein